MKAQYQFVLQAYGLFPCLLIVISNVLKGYKVAVRCIRVIFNCLASVQTFAKATQNLHVPFFQRGMEN